jgi:hypothetical protein
MMINEYIPELFYALTVMPVVFRINSNGRRCSEKNVQTGANSRTLPIMTTLENEFMFMIVA